LETNIIPFNQVPIPLLTKLFLGFFMRCVFSAPTAKFFELDFPLSARGGLLFVLSAPIINSFAASAL